ncbi:MAG: DNA polymerase III subunit beta [Candidatus Hydrogenedentota bacterium]
MRFKVHKNVLLENVQITSGVIPVRHTVYLVSFMLIEADSSLGKITLSGTDLETSITNSFQCEVTESGSLTVPGKKFNELLRELPDESIEIYTEENNMIIKCKKDHIILKGQPRDDFPVLPKVKKDNVIMLDQNVFRDLIRKINYAAPIDDSRQCLNGGYLHIVGKELKFVATDGHRLALAKTEIEIGIKDETGIIIPVKTLSELLRIIKGEAEVVISFSSNQISFEMDSIILISRLIEEKYPNYAQVIPQKQDHIAVVDRAELLAETRRIALLVSERGYSVKYKFENRMLFLYSTSPDIGEGTAELAIEYEGEEVQIVLNALYMLDVVKNIETESIEIHFSNKLSPVVIKPVGKDDYLCLIMPMRQ